MSPWLNGSAKPLPSARPKNGTTKNILRKLARQNLCTNHALLGGKKVAWSLLPEERAADGNRGLAMTNLRSLLSGNIARASSKMGNLT